MATDVRAELLAEPTDLDRAYWDGLSEGKLRVQQCGACKSYQAPPETFCYKCGSDDITWKDATGRGQVFSFITVHQKYHPAFYELVPYNVSVVELAEGPRLIANLIDIDPHEVQVGMDVKATMRPVGDRVALFFERA